MKRLTNKLTLLIFGGIVIGAAFSMQSCSKNNNGGGTPPPSGPTSSSDSVEPQALVLYWNFDNSPNETKLGLTGTGTGVTYVTGVRGQAYQGAAGAYITVPTGTDSTMLASAFNSFSVSVWYSLPSADKPQPGGSAQGMFFMSDANPGSDGNEFLLETDVPSANQLATDSVVIHHGFDDFGSVGPYDNFTLGSFDTATSNWVHVCFTYNGASSTYTYYENGQPVAVSSAYGVQTSTVLYTNSLPATGPNPPELGPFSMPAGHYPTTFYIGTWPPGLYGVSPTLGSNGCFLGAMDELRVFNIALNTQDVADLYSDGLAGK